VNTLIRPCLKGGLKEELKKQREKVTPDQDHAGNKGGGRERPVQRDREDGMCQKERQGVLYFARTGNILLVY